MNTKFSLTLASLPLFFSLILCGRVLYDYKIQGKRDTFRLGVGSCFDGKQKVTDIFKDVNQEDLDIWIWLGDFAYVDKKFGCK